MYILKPILSIVLLCGGVWALNTRFGLVPPLGKILDPAAGIWRNAEPLGKREDIGAGIGLVRSDVVVSFDRNDIPHLFAGNDPDLYFAQGYVTARDRLWQMEIQVRSASGRLSEIFGQRTLAQDMFCRRLGLAYAAGKMLDSVLRDSSIRITLESYTAGVNAYIHQLTRSSYPLEYKLFDCRPEEWRPVNSLLILKLMAQTLTGGESEFGMTNTLMRMGADTTKELFSHPLLDEEPVIPDSMHGHSPPYSGPSNAEVAGSNNWAISGRASANKYPLLANDPHLKLTLPSIWYQLQMRSPGVDVYGVSIPGVPCIVIGFNRQIAWGLTNAAADVLDWYRIRFKDRSMKEYWYDGKWDPTDLRVEKYGLPDGSRSFDTIYYTRQGPVVYDGITHKRKGLAEPAGPLEGFALRWTMHETSNDLKTFYLLNRAGNFNDYRHALTYFCCPAQNFVFADKDEDIAMTSSGKFPLRNRGQGEFVLDGSIPANDWQGWVPRDQDPYIRNPVRGFVSSANQVLTGPEYPYYIPGHFSLPYRARRINSRLASMKDANVDSFRTMQTDSYSGMAAETLPAMLGRLDRSRIRDGDEAIHELEHWDYKYQRGSKAATLFTAWWGELYTAIWKDEMENKDVPLSWPDYRKTASLIVQDTNSHWIDDVNTTGKETLSEILNASFKKTLYELRKKYGRFGDTWTWGNTRYCSISSITNIPSFGIGFTGTDGAPNTIDALSDKFGPSWRMVVSLGPSVKGYGILPGGQSGNPGSYFYDDLAQSWREGSLNELLFLDSASDRKDQLRYTLTFTK